MLAKSGQHTPHTRTGYNVFQIDSSAPRMSARKPASKALDTGTISGSTICDKDMERIKQNVTFLMKLKIPYMRPYWNKQARAQTEMCIGGIVEEYENKWGFRFKPETIIVAQITIEGAQSNIQCISRDLDYWIKVWSKEAYVPAKVTEIHK